MGQSQKSYRTTEKKGPGLLPFVFVAGFVLCLFLCRLTAGDLHRYTTTEFSKIYLFLYANLPCAIGKLMGVQDSSTFGNLYTLGASLFFIIMAALLYCHRTDEEFSDEADSEFSDSLLRRILHYLCVFPFLQMVTFATINIEYGLDFVRKPGFFNVVAPLLFFGFTAIEFFTAETRAQKRKSIYRLLASVGVALGIAGLGSRIFDSGESKYILAVSVRRMLIRFGELCGTSILGTFAMLFLIGLCAALVVFCFRKVFFAADDLRISVLCTGGHLLLLFGFYYLTEFFNASWQTGIINAKLILYWLLILCVITIWTVWYARISRRSAATICVGSVGFFTCVPACLDCLRAFSGGVSHNLLRISALGAPVEAKLLSLIDKIPEGHWGNIALYILLLVVVVVLYIFLYAPLSPDEGKAYTPMGHPSFVKFSSLLFLLGYDLCCLPRMYPNIAWAGTAGYYICALAAMLAISGLSYCMLSQCRDGIRTHLTGLVITLVWVLLLSLCAMLISAVVAAVGGVFALLAAVHFFSEVLNTPRTKRDIRWDKEEAEWRYKQEVERIAAAERNGEISSFDAREMELRAFKDKYARVTFLELEEELYDRENPNQSDE